ncbi:AAA family ATPase [Candidatus Dependentiae bacterium]|nr:AAA family ATPase [Candidatus Dependentiae bacterium]
MKRIATGTSSFEKLINGNFIYIDKTKIIYDLITGETLYFLSRPRRFGKTLLISTLKELFEGNRELFKGLWIDSSDYTWEPHPVISLNFSSFMSNSPEDLKKGVALLLDAKAESLGIDLSRNADPEGKLHILLLQLSKKKKVVILIDEYDYPIISNLDNPTVMKENLKVLDGFFTAIKSFEEYLRALFITGVSPLPKTSTYSGMSILNNLSLDPLAATLLGYTKEEIDFYFSEHSKKLADLKKTSLLEIENAIQEWYNGYKFSKLGKKVYNPFSVHYLFTKNEFANYWFNVATPKFLLYVLKKNNYNLQTLEVEPFLTQSLTSLDFEKPELAPVLFQTGYLTLSSFNEKNNTYTLAYPNREVKESYTISLMSSFTLLGESTLNNLIDPLRNALFNNDMQELCALLKIIFAQIPHQIGEHHEKFYHALVQSFLVLLGFESKAEISTNRGRIDLVVYTKKFTYIIEFKVKTVAETALKQIEDKAYYEGYLSSPKMEKQSTIVLVGLTFSKINGEPTISCEHKVLS